MTVSSTSTVLDQSSDAAFRTWIQEIITQLVSTCGVTQTADTGQVNTATVTRTASLNTAAGFIILRFNDTLQSTAPVFMKVEFGTGAVASTSPQMWITTGTGSNGSGTLTGTTTTRVAVGNGQVATSLITSFTSRFVYNSTFGYLGCAWKQNAETTAGPNGFHGGLVVHRSNDTTGAANADAVIQFADSSTATGTNNGGFEQSIGFGTSLAYPPTVANGGQFLGSNGGNGFPFGLTSSTVAGNSYTVPIVYMTPIPNVSSMDAAALMAEASVGSTFVETLVGTTSLTFLSCGGMFGGSTGTVWAATALTFCMLWQ